MDDPDLRPFRCSKCKLIKPAMAFTKSNHDLKKRSRPVAYQCRECIKENGQPRLVKCPECGNWFKGHLAINGQCYKCNNTLGIKFCNKCQEPRFRWAEYVGKGRTCIYCLNAPKD